MATNAGIDGRLPGFGSVSDCFAVVLWIWIPFRGPVEFDPLRRAVGVASGRGVSDRVGCRQAGTAAPFWSIAFATGYRLVDSILGAPGGTSAASKSNSTSSPVIARSSMGRSGESARDLFTGVIAESVRHSRQDS